MGECEMPVSVPVETAEHHLRSLLARLELGETVTLVDPEGVPEALLVSLKAPSNQAQSLDDWEARWDRLARKIGQAWKGDKSAQDVLREMRR
jgi:antitoxin (DNA-binding transcriptional repressor) of toxin-antitoxin stability system